MVDNNIRRAYRALRVKGFGAQTALEIAKTARRKPVYAFLSKLDIGKNAIGEIGPFVVEAKIVQDDESWIGQDDVTGWFTDVFEDGCVKNTNRSWGTDMKYYHPSNYTLQHAFDEARRAGMSKQVAREYVAHVIEREMYEDANREYFGVEVRVSIGIRVLGQASLWSIDTTPDNDPLPYFIEVSADLIGDALDEARGAIPSALRTSLAEAGTLVAGLEALRTPSP